MTRWLQLLVLGIASSGVEARAHHAISAVYDRTKQATVEGVVTDFQFINPHPLVIVDVADRNGQTQPWRLEMDNRFELVAIGVTSETLKRGDRIVVTGSLARERPRGLYVLQLNRPSDGFEYEQIGPSPRIRAGRSR